MLVDNTSLTISLYASLLNLGVSLMVPINTKNRPRANERATMVIVLGEAIFIIGYVPPAPRRLLHIEVMKALYSRQRSGDTGGGEGGRSVGFWMCNKNGDYRDPVITAG